MMHADDMNVKVRKKPLTYGKSSRRAYHDAEHPTFEFLSDEDDTDWEKNHSAARAATVESSRATCVGQRDQSFTVGVLPDTSNQSAPPEVLPYEVIPHNQRNAKRTSPSDNDHFSDKRRKLRSEEGARVTAHPNNAKRKDKETTTTEGARGAGFQGMPKPQRRQEHSSPSTQRRAQAVVTSKSQLRTRPNTSGINSLDKATHRRTTSLAAVADEQSYRHDSSGKDNSSSTASSTTKDTLHGSKTPPPRAADTLLSPSNLQIPELQISSVRPQSTRGLSEGKDTVVGTSRLATSDSPSRPKLKNKLNHGLNKGHVKSPKDLKGIENGSSTWLIGESAAEKTGKPSSVNYKKAISSEDSNGDKVLTAISAIQSQGPKKTYGAGHRTLLQESTEPVLESSAFLDLSLPQQPKRGRELPEPAGFLKGASEDQENEELLQPGMRSIYELREAGLNQRLNRQIEALVDDIESCVSIRQRRVALLELVKQLLSPTFLRQFRDSGCDVRLTRTMKSNHDEITRFLFSAAFLIISDGSDLAVLLDGQTRYLVIDLLSENLVFDEDFADLLRSRKLAASRDLQKECHKICEFLITLPLWKNGRPSQVTLQTIALQGLECIVRESREAGSRDDLLDKEAIKRLVGILDSAELGPSGKGTVNAQVNTHLALSTLESSAIVYSMADKDYSSLWTDASISDLGTFIVNLLRSTGSSGGLLSLGLRLSLNLSNSSPSVCAVLARSDVIEACLQAIVGHFMSLSGEDTGGKRDLLLDNLVLMLGFLINLAEKHGETCEIFLETSRNSSLHIDTVIDLFLTRSSNAFEVTSEDETKFNVPFGWLAVLLAYLSRDVAIRARLKGRLERGTLEQLLNAVTEFLSYHRKIAKELLDPDGELDVKANFTQRLQELIDTLAAEETLG